MCKYVYLALKNPPLRIRTIRLIISSKQFCIVCVTEFITFVRYLTFAKFYNNDRHKSRVFRKNVEKSTNGSSRNDAQAMNSQLEALFDQQISLLNSLPQESLQSYLSDSASLHCP